MKLKVITINCFDSPLLLKRSTRINRLITELIKLEADVFCIQELVFLKRVKRVSRLFEDAGYNTFFTPGKRINQGGLLIASRYPFVDTKYVKFKKQPLSFSFQMTDRLLSKGYQKVTIDVEGDNYSLYNTHLVSIYRDSSLGEKIISLMQFREFLEVIKNEVSRTIVAGDFNFTPSNSFYRRIKRKTNLYDPMQGSNLVTISRSNTNRKRFFKIDKDSRLDYILISKDLKIITQRVILDDLYEIKKKKIHLSDHFGLMVEVSD